MRCASLTPLIYTQKMDIEAAELALQLTRKMGDIRSRKRVATGSNPLLHRGSRSIHPIYQLTLTYGEIGREKQRGQVESAQDR